MNKKYVTTTEKMPRILKFKHYYQKTERAMSFFSILIYILSSIFFHIWKTLVKIFSQQTVYYTIQQTSEITYLALGKTSQ